MTPDDHGPQRSGPRRSPLAMVVLALLGEAPMHVYRMDQLIRERAKDTVVNIGSRNSIHQVAERLRRDALITVHDTEDAGRGRTTYALTATGAQALQDWLVEALGRPRNEFPEFPAALAFVALLSPGELAEYLQHRADRLEQLLAEPDPETVMREHRLHRIFLIEDEYRRAMHIAELRWVRDVIADLRAGTFAWPRHPIAQPGSDPAGR